MTTKRIEKNTWNKIVAPAANTVYLALPPSARALLQYGATAPAAGDDTGLPVANVVTINAGLTAFLRCADHQTIFVTDTAGADAMVDTNAPLHLTTNLPATKTGTAGTNFTLTVAAAGGVAPLTYEWYYNPGYGADVRVNGATAATLTLTAPETTRSGVYRVIVRDATGHAVGSGLCQVTINPVTP